MNFFDKAELINEDGITKVKIHGAVMDLPENVANKLSGKTGKIIAGVRPNHIKFSKTSGPHTIAGKVDVSEMMGSEIHLHVDADGKDVVMIINATELPDTWRGGIPYGTTVYFTFPGSLIHLFDPDSENNLI